MTDQGESTDLSHEESSTLDLRQVAIERMKLVRKGRSLGMSFRQAIDEGRR